MRIAFIWNGFNGRYGQWQDGLWAAMKLIELEHDVAYFDTDQLDKLKEFNPDVVLFWEAPCSLRGKDAHFYRNVMELPYKKALLFAGGPVERETCTGFDLYFVESAINEREFEQLGLPWKRAFGVNTQIFKPDPYQKVYDGVLQATWAGWKRHELLGEALGDKALCVGRLQEHDRHGYNVCVEKGVKILPEMSAKVVAMLINKSHTVVNPSSYWGGGQRCSVEALACGVPVVVMSDSPKNREFVEESGFGLVVDPNPVAIREAVEQLKSSPLDPRIGYNYIHSKFTERHYADAIMEGVRSII